MKVVFDLGNVVLDWNTNKILDSLNVSQVDRELLKNRLFEHQDWLDMDHGIMSEQSVVTRVSKATNLETNIVEQALLTAKRSLLPIAQSIELMNDFHKAKIAMYCLSNMSVETYDFVKEQKFFSLFSGIVISGHEKCMKPDTKIFEILLNRYKLLPSETFFIDDSLPNIKASEKLGMSGHHFKRTEDCYSKIRTHLL
ncbi:HAD family hydrolase [Aliikangiella coralliicola]|uniref:HAD family phosphatase n=1 Tax=Aliikangiella coralliicola TaxID=2592383 RepID=A0A545UAS2_9GAMM|nr:HAD family phosphatase [Aliikangiella coralliicola]TQV86533.1 HAD family phosphatase [Aliikangiella coralliicola]